MGPLPAVKFLSRKKAKTRHSVTFPSDSDDLVDVLYFEKEDSDLESDHTQTSEPEHQFFEVPAVNMLDVQTLIMAGKGKPDKL